MTEKNTNTRLNPFPGLRAYRPDEGHLFFGRNESTSKVVMRLKESRFVSVIGASGSGKSSLVLSGVIPALLRENAEGKRVWSYVVLKPGVNPIDNLAEELSALSASAGFTQLTRSNVAASLHNRSEGITDVVNKMRKNLRQQVVIVVDQFEELFRYSVTTYTAPAGDDTADFIDLIVNAVQQPDQGLHIILTLRSEYVSECSRFHSLTNLMNTGSYLLPQINLDLLSTVIEEPVKASGATIDRSLVRLIIGDIPDKPGQLPVLQHLLMRMWNQWSKPGDMSRPISLVDYEAVGRFKGAISQHAAQAMDMLDERHKYVCSRLFRSITVRSDDGKELRRPQSISVIASQTGCTVEEIIRVADVFRSPEFSYITPESDVPLNRDSTINLSHESIIRLWGQLRSWLDDEDTARKTYLQLAAAAEQYQEGKGKLWTTPDLLIALKWREENHPTLAWAEKIDPAFERTMLFLKNSEEEYHVQEEYTKKAGAVRIKRSRLVASLLGLAVLLALIAVGTLVTLRNRSEKERSVAQQLKNEALAYSALLSDSLSLLNDTLRTAEQKAGMERMNAIAAAGKVRDAEERASEAGSMLQDVINEKTAATIMAAGENRNRMLAVARSLALRSVNHAGEKDLQVLLAWQAYLFNDRHEGLKDDPDIFSALYEVGKWYGNRYFAKYKPDGASVTAMAEGTDGHIFYTADTGGRIIRWRTDQPGKDYNLIWSGDKVIEVLTVSPDGSWLACGTTSSEIVMIPLSDDSIGYQLQNAKGSVTSLAFTAEGDHLYSSEINGSVDLWDLRSRQASSVANDPAGIVSLDISADNALLAAVTKDGRLLMWKLGSTTGRYDLSIGNRVLTALRFVPGDNQLATGDAAGMIDIWNTDTGAMEANIEAHSSVVSAIAFDGNDEKMLTADRSGNIKIWTLSDLGQPPAVISDSESEIIHLAFNEEDNAFLAATKTEVTERPAHVRCMTDGLCSKVTRNLSPAEWSAYVGRGIEYEPTCPNRSFQIRVREITGSQ